MAANNIYLNISNVINKNIYLIAFSLLGIVYFFNFFIDIMDIDAAQFALISMEMNQNSSFLQVFQRHQDYLDKPPLLFWVSSLSFYIFGISTFSYKLPSVLVLILGIYSLYRFTRLFYSFEIARLAALIFSSTQMILLITNDIRTDCMLVGWISFALWQISTFIKLHSIKNLIWGSIGIGFAMLTKGPIGFLIPMFPVFVHLLITKQYKIIFNFKWLILIFIVGVMLSPMLYGLYQQFDLHPEKYVYELHGPSGIKFYFWTQSFGRITGESSWADDTSYFYFFHTFLWDFQPWVFIFITALLFQIGSLFSKIKSKPVEYITLFGFLFFFLGLSKSHFKLPHYIFPIFPFAAVITAQFLYKFTNPNSLILKSFMILQAFITTIFYGIVIFCFLYIFPSQNKFPLVLIGIIFLGHIYYIFTKHCSNLNKLLLITIQGFIVFGLTTSLYFYPNLLQYQSGSQAGKFLLNHSNSKSTFYWYKDRSYSLEFYSHRIIPELDTNKIKNIPQNCFIFTTMEGAQQIMLQQPQLHQIKTFENFAVTGLTIQFLLPKSRASQLSQRVILSNQDLN